MAVCTLVLPPMRVSAQPRAQGLSASGGGRARCAAGPRWNVLLRRLGSGRLRLFGISLFQCGDGRSGE